MIASRYSCHSRRAEEVKGGVRLDFQSGGAARRRLRAGKWQRLIDMVATVRIALKSRLNEMARQ